MHLVDLPHLFQSRLLFHTFESIRIPELVRIEVAIARVVLAETCGAQIWDIFSFAAESINTGEYYCAEEGDDYDDGNDDGWRDAERGIVGALTNGLGGPRGHCRDLQNVTGDPRL
jgi:hypothetical protein